MPAKARSLACRRSSTTRSPLRAAEPPGSSSGSGTTSLHGHPEPRERADDLVEVAGAMATHVGVAVLLLDQEEGGRRDGARARRVAAVRDRRPGGTALPQAVRFSARAWLTGLEHGAHTLALRGPRAKGADPLHERQRLEV